MQVDILTLFPEMFVGPFNESIVKRAIDKDIVKINIRNLREWSTDKHKSVDAPPYGGGAGMVLRVDVLDAALSDIKTPESHVALLNPQGAKYTQQIAQRLIDRPHIILVAGHYEGFDERIRKHLVDEELSIGDYVLTGGELPAMVVVDSLVRLLPGALGDPDSLEGETHSSVGHTKHPVYTHPREYKGLRVPEVLVSGDHAKIARWKSEH